MGDSDGLKFFAVSGHVERPGVYCVPMGTTIRDLLDLAGGVAGGAALDSVQPGGASSTSSARNTSTCRSTSARSPRPARCWARARWW